MSDFPACEDYSGPPMPSLVWRNPIADASPPAVPAANFRVVEVSAEPAREPGYHLRPIQKGVVGEASKIREEAEEFIEALEQGVAVMALVELSDLIGAIQSFLFKEFPGSSYDIDCFDQPTKTIISGTSDDIMLSVEELVALIEAGYGFDAALSNVIYAIETYLGRNHPSIGIPDLIKMAAVTRRAFKNGRR